MDGLGRAKRWALVGAGHAFVTIGVVGMFLPVLPTTPFLLLAAACYVRASERHYRWITEHRIFGPIIRDYRERHGIRLRTKIVALALLWLSLGISMYRVRYAALDVLLVVIGVVATVMILRIRTLDDGVSSSGANLE